MARFKIDLKYITISMELIRYALVGIVTNSVGYLIYLFFIYIGLAPKASMTITYGLGATMGFFGNRSITFSYKGSLLGSGIRYVISHVLGYCINLTMFIIFVDNFGYSHQLVQAMAIFVVAIFLFTMFKFFVFRSPRYWPV